MLKSDSKQRLFEVMGRVDKTFKPKLNESYSDYLDTNYSADGMEDYHADKAAQMNAENLYDKGLELYKAGDVNGAEELRQEALRVGASLSWDETELPPYGNQNTNENEISNQGNHNNFDQEVENVIEKELMYQHDGPVTEFVVIARAIRLARTNTAIKEDIISNALSDALDILKKNGNHLPSNEY